MVNSLRFCVAADDDGARVDRVVRTKLDVSRSTLQAWFADGCVSVNAHRVSKGHIVKLGDTILVEPPMAALPGAEVLDVRLETAQLLVVHKPAGQPSVALGSSQRWALSQSIAAYCPEVSAIGYSPADAGLLHRLDNDTSGLLLVAKQQAAFTELLHGLRSGWLHKRYLALVSSAPPSSAGSVTAALEPHPSNRRKVAIVPGADRKPLGYAATTSYRVLGRGPELWLLELSASPAYRHQIRVHLASVGCPLLGDTLYGGKEHAGLARHALHASSLAWPGGVEVPAFNVEAAVPADLQSVIDAGYVLPINPAPALG